MPHIPGHGFTTNMSSSISDILSSQGYNMSALTAPGTLYGFGAGQTFNTTEYDEFFRPFDLEGFQEARMELQNLETRFITKMLVQTIELPNQGYKLEQLLHNKLLWVKLVEAV